MLVLFFTIKCLFFLRVFQQFSQLVTLVSSVVSDVAEFLLFFMTWVFIFGVLNMIAGEETDTVIGMNSVLSYSIQIFNNAIGNIATPTYTKWTAIKDTHPNLSTSMVGYLWILWFLQILFMLITLLNFLIAIISDSYADVMSKALVHQYSSKCDFNEETQVIFNMFPGWFDDSGTQGRVYVMRSSKDVSNPAFLHPSAMPLISSYNSG